MERRIKFFATDISTKKRKRTVVIELFFQVDFSFNFETEKKKIVLMKITPIYINLTWKTSENQLS